jgi:hypothetical protein
MVEVVVNNWILRGDVNVVEHISNVGLEGYNVLRRREVIHGTCLLGFFSDVRIGLFHNLLILVNLEVFFSSIKN